MNHLMDRLASAGKLPAQDMPDETLQTVLRRGHAVAARRRQRASGAVLAVAVVGVGVAGVSGAFSSGHSPASAASNPATANSIRLVAYTGAQPNGFHIAQVPEGYGIASSTAEGVQLVPSDTTPGAANAISIELVGNDSPVYGLLDRCQDVAIDSHGYAHPDPSTGKQRGCYAVAPGSAPATTYLQWNTGHYQVLVTSNAAVLTKAQDIEFADGVTTVGQPRNPDGSSAVPTQPSGAGTQPGATSLIKAKENPGKH